MDWFILFVLLYILPLQQISLFLFDMWSESKPSQNWDDVSLTGR